MEMMLQAKDTCTNLEILDRIICAYFMMSDFTFSEFMLLQKTDMFYISDYRITCKMIVHLSSY